MERETPLNIAHFTGAGRFALDAATPWGRRPAPFGLAGLALAVVTSVAVLTRFP